jgi:hypothetical protein
MSACAYVVIAAAAKRKRGVVKRDSARALNGSAEERPMRRGAGGVMATGCRWSTSLRGTGNMCRLLSTLPPRNRRCRRCGRNHCRNRIQRHTHSSYRNHSCDHIDSFDRSRNLRRSRSLNRSRSSDRCGTHSIHSQSYNRIRSFRHFRSSYRSRSLRRSCSFHRSRSFRRRDSCRCFHSCRRTRHRTN